MAKSISLAELPSRTRGTHGERKPRKPSNGNLERGAKAVAAELSALPLKPLLIGAGIGAAVLGTAMAVGSKRQAAGLSFGGINQTLARTVLVALARVVSGQTARAVASRALLDVADAMKD